MDTLYQIIKSEVDKTQYFINELLKRGIDQKDVRNAFFELFQNYYSNFYRTHSYMDSELFNKDSEQIYFNIKGYENEKNKINLSAHLNYSLIIETWSTFELCINQICKAILADDAIEKLLVCNYSRIIRVLDKSISPDLNDALLKDQKLKYLEHASINLKTDQLYKIISYKDFKIDKEFLLFYGKLRNSIHTNYVYYGKEFRYIYKGTTYSFEPCKPIKQEPLDWENNLSIFQLSVELREIYFRIISNFTYNGLIFDPSFFDTK